MEQFMKYYSYYFVFTYMLKSAITIKFDVSLMVMDYDIDHCVANSGAIHKCSVNINLKSGKNLRCPPSGMCCGNCKSSNCFCSGDSTRKVYRDNPDEGMNSIMVEITVCKNSMFVLATPDFICREHQLKDTVNEIMYANHTNGLSFRVKWNIMKHRDTTIFQTSEASSSRITTPTVLISTSLIGSGISPETSSPAQNVSNRTLHQVSLSTSVIGPGVSPETSSPVQSVSNRTPHQGNKTTIIIGCIIGAVVLIGIIIFVVLLLKCKNKKNRQGVEHGDENRQKCDANQQSSPVNEPRWTNTENQGIDSNAIANGLPPPPTSGRLTLVSSAIRQNRNKNDVETLYKPKKNKSKKVKEKKEEMGDVDNNSLPVPTALARGSSLVEHENNVEQNNDIRKSKKHKKKNRHKSSKHENFEGDPYENDTALRTDIIHNQRLQCDSNKAGTSGGDGLTNGHDEQSLVNTEKDNGQHTLKMNKNENEYNLKKRNKGKKKRKKGKSSNEGVSNANIDGNSHGEQETDADVALVLKQHTSGMYNELSQDKRSNIDNEGNFLEPRGNDDEHDGENHKRRKNKSKKSKKASKHRQIEQKDGKLNNNDENKEYGIPAPQDFELGTGNNREINRNATIKKDNVGEKDEYEQEEIAEYSMVNEQSEERKKKKKKKHKKKKGNTFEQQYVNNNGSDVEDQYFDEKDMNMQYMDSRSFIDRLICVGRERLRAQHGISE